MWLHKNGPDHGSLLWDSAALFDPLTATALVLTAAGTAVTAAGTIAGGKRAQEAAEFRAQQMDAAAPESVAVAQRQAFERRRAAKLTLSSLQARAAAQGGGGDPDIVKISGDIAQRGEYQALSEMWTGEARAAGLRTEAGGARATGKAAVEGSYYSAAGTILSGLGGMAKTYGQMTAPPAPGPPKDINFWG